MLNIVKFVLMICIFEHWIACFWGITAKSFVPPTSKTWVTSHVENMAENYPDFNCTCKCSRSINVPYDLCVNAAYWKCVEPGQVYIASLYWAVMTVTSIGYGDILPHQEIEYWVATILMLMGSFVWAYVIGAICAAAASLDPIHTEFQNQLDSLNHYLHDRHVEPHLSWRIRSFFHKSRVQFRESTTKPLLCTMSPALGAQLVYSSSPFLKGDAIFFLRGIKNLDYAAPFVVDLVCSLRTACYPGQEIIYQPDTMFILKTGVVGQRGRPRRAGAVWGEDCLVLNNAVFITPLTTNCLSHVMVFTLNKPTFNTLCGKHDLVAQFIRRRASWFAVTKAFRKIGEAVIQRRDVGLGFPSPDVHKHDRRLFWEEVFRIVGRTKAASLLKQQAAVQVPPKVRRRSSLMQMFLSIAGKASLYTNPANQVTPVPIQRSS